MVYATKTRGRTLTLRVSGMLWNRSLVMEDVETGSLWSHILGKAMQGELAGATLDVLPAVMTTWADWKRAHPGTTVLDMSRTASSFDRDAYRPASKFVLGVVIDGSPKAYPYDLLSRTPVIEDEIAGRPVLVAFDPESTRGAIWSRRVGDRVLDFDVSAKGSPESGVAAIRDTATRSSWDPLSGACVSGELEGRRLEALPAIVSHRKAWRVFHPHSAWAGARPAKRPADLLARFGESYRDIDHFMRPLDDDGWKLRFRTLRELTLLGREATADLVAALADSRPAVGVLAAQALSFIGDPAARPALERAAVESSSRALRLYAVDAIGAAGGKRSSELLEKISRDDSNGDVRAHARFALERDGAGIGTLYRDLLRDFDPARIDTAVVGRPAPEFALESHDGRSVRLSTFRGKRAVLLVFIYGDT